MPQEELGYVELEWTCKNCGTRNPGTRKTCRSCGAALGAQDKFELPAQQEIITDAAKIEQAKVGPDVKCPYCGTLNPANATSCKQCGGDLKGAQVRFKGGVLGAFDDSPQPDVKCQNCGSMNPAGATKCSTCGASLQRPAPKSETPAPQPLSKPQSLNPFLIGAIALIALVCLGGLFFFVTRTNEVSGTVASVNWQRTIAILALTPVRDADWRDQLPASATVASCEMKPRRYSNLPEPNSEKVCSTPYVIDQGNGIGQVVQDCQYLVSDSYCSFTRLQWTVIDTVAARGTDLNPVWPALALQSGQREGNRAEDYRVVFDAGAQRYSYTPANLNEFTRFKPGSRWNLQVNGLGDIVSAQPAQ